MTAQTVIPPVASGKVETKSAAPSIAPRKTVKESPAKVYWGDRLTIVFWLCCFALMAGMNLVEAVHRFILYLFGSPSSTP